MWPFSRNKLVILLRNRCSFLPSSVAKYCQSLPRLFVLASTVPHGKFQLSGLVEVKLRLLGRAWKNSRGKYPNF